MAVYKKLQDARVKLSSVEMKKSGHNKFAGYNYFELGDFLPHIQKIFNETGLCSVVSFTADIATLRIIDTDDGSEVSITSPMGSAALKGVHEVQNIGAVETYQRRYLYITAMEIVEHDALDATTAKDKPAPAKPEPIKLESAKPVSVDTFSKMDSDTQDYLRSVAAGVIAMLAKDEIENAYDYIVDEGIDDDADLKVGLWSLLDSKQRAAIKQISTTKKAA